MKSSVLSIVGVIVTAILLGMVHSQSARLHSDRKRLLLRPGESPFRFARRYSKPLVRYGEQFGNNRRHKQVFSKLGPKAEDNSRKSRGEFAALKAGKEGSYDFKDQFNAILPDKTYAKPVKAATTTVNPNKINIESQIPVVTETQTTLEKATLGGTAILHCYFDSDTQIGQYKHSQIWWTKQAQRADDRPIILGAGTQIRLPDDRLKLVNFANDSFSILIIKQLLRSDAGEYKCSLPTISGTKTRFTSLKVYDPVQEDIDTSVGDHVTELGENLDLYCRPSNPQLNVWWTAKRENGENIEIVKGKHKVVTRELELKRLSRREAGVYTCHVQVEVGSPIRRSFNVQVKEKPWLISAFNGGFNVDTFLSKFAKDPEYGKEVNLRCDTGGIPTPTISWYQDGRPLTKNSKYRIKSYEPTYNDNAVIGSLVIQDFSPDDEGRYQCKAINDMGTRQREFTLKGPYDVQPQSKSGQTPRIVDDEDVELPSADLISGVRKESGVHLEGSGEE